MILSIIFIVVAYFVGFLTHYLHIRFSYLSKAFCIVNKQTEEGETKALTIFYDEEYYEIEKRALLTQNIIGNYDERF